MWMMQCCVGFRIVTCYLQYFVEFVCNSFFSNWTAFVPPVTETSRINPEIIK